MKAVSEYFKNLRAALADTGHGGIYRYKDQSLQDALVTTVQLGMGPKGVAVNDDGTHFDPGPATPDARGWLVFQTALIMVGGAVPVGFKTRALQVRVDGMERMTTVDYLRRQIKRLETSGDPHGDGGSSCFGIWQDLENELERVTAEPERVA
jgi:hypothetical protein